MMDHSSNNKNSQKRSPLRDVDTRRSRSGNRNVYQKNNKPKLKNEDVDYIQNSNNGGRRRSPRKHNQSIQDQDKEQTTSLQKSKSKAVVVPESILSTSSKSQSLNPNYRIPKKTNSDGQQDAIKKVPQQSSSINANTKTILVEKSPVQHDGIKKQSKPQDEQQSLLKRNQQQVSFLHAKRRLGNDRQTKMVDGKAADVAQKSKPNISPPPLLINNKTLVELPDYEDSEDDLEEVQQQDNNPMPNIFKMVKESIQDPVGMEDMDVDVELPLQPERIVIIPDTNVWINDLSLIQKLVNGDFSKTILILIPWMVLQELDVTHHKNKQSYMTMKKPIQYIHGLLQSNHPRVKGQKAIEASISKLKFEELVADDSILNCVFQTMNYNNTTVIFLSNDKNLLSKALVNGIIAADSKNALKKLTEVLENKSTNNSCYAPSPLFATENYPSPSSPLSNNKRRFHSSSSDSGILDNDVEMEEDLLEEGPNNDSPLCKVRAVAGKPFSSSKPENKFQKLETALLKSFSCIIQKKMIEDYGISGWKYALKIKPPFTLISAIKCMLVHWIANFSFAFAQRGQRHLENLKQMVEHYKSPRVVNTENMEEQIIDSAASLFNFINKDFEQEVVECKKVLLELSQFGEKQTF